MRRIGTFLGVGVALLGLDARAVWVESGYMAGEFRLRNEMALLCGPQTIIEGLSFYLADKDWHPVFPTYNAPGYAVSVSGTTATMTSKANPAVKVEQVYTITPDGMRVDITAQVLPNSGACYAVCDMFISKPVFANAPVKRDGQPPLVLDPAKWTTIDVDRVTLATSDGDWVFTFSSSGPGKWGLRSVCDRAWGPDEKKTFSFLNQAGDVPAEGLTEKLSIEARFVPKPDYAAKIDSMFAEKTSSYLTSLLSRYGITPAATELPADPAQRAAWLTGKVCDVSANLAENGFDPQAGEVIPAPKSYQKGTGVFVVPQNLDIACSPTHEAALEVLTEDLTRFGVRVARTELPAEPSGLRSVLSLLHLQRTPRDLGLPAMLTMGVWSRDAFVRNACKRLGIEVSEKSRGPEGYVLAVTPTMVVIAGGDDAGVLYGAQTLRQLLRKGAAGAELPVVTINDWPDMKFRGFYVEGADRVANTEELRRLIRNTYSYFKANTVAFEVRWSLLQWKSHPELASDKALPVEDLAAISAYARRFHLEVIPAVFTYGKVGDLVRKHPEIAEVPDTGKNEPMDQFAYCPNKPESYALVFDLLNEVVQATQCRRLHIGHDEIKGMALCPTCKAMPPADLFANDVNKIAGWLAERHVETLIWGDFLLDGERWKPLGVDAANSGNPYYGGLDVAPAADKIRKDVIIADWHYCNAKTYPSLAYFAEKGFRVIGCPWHKTGNNYWITQGIHAINQMGVLVTDWGFLATRSPGADSMISVACAWDTAMPDPDHLTWSPEAVLAASIIRKDRPSGFAGANFAPVSLEPAANRPLSGTENAWFGASMRHGLVAPPAGAKRLFGVDYQIGEKCVVVGNAKTGQGIEATSAKIPVNMTARSLVFLQALAVDEPAVGLRAYGQYHVTYASGQTADVAIDGRNITHWLSRAPRQNPWMPWLYGQTWDATLAWEGCTKSGEPVNIQAYEWVNPRPDDPIASVEMTAKQDVAGLKLGLVALTVVR